MNDINESLIEKMSRLNIPHTVIINNAYLVDQIDYFLVVHMKIMRNYKFYMSDNPSYGGCYYIGMNDRDKECFFKEMDSHYNKRVLPKRYGMAYERRIEEGPFTGETIASLIGKKRLWDKT